MTSLVALARHGQTDWNQQRRFQGRLDVPLNEAGRRESLRLAHCLADSKVPWRTLLTSDLARSADTASIIGDALGLVPTPLADLREVDVGQWSGLAGREIELRFPAEYAAWKAGRGSFVFPKGETTQTASARAERVRLAIELHPNGRIIVVSHGLFLEVLTAVMLGLRVEQTLESKSARLANCGVTVLGTTTGSTWKLLPLDALAGPERSTGPTPPPILGLPAERIKSLMERPS